MGNKREPILSGSFCLSTVGICDLHQVGRRSHQRIQSWTPCPGLLMTVCYVGAALCTGSVYEFTTSFYSDGQCGAEAVLVLVYYWWQNQSWREVNDTLVAPRPVSSKEPGPLGPLPGVSSLPQLFRGAGCLDGLLNCLLWIFCNVTSAPEE